MSFIASGLLGGLLITGGFSSATPTISAAGGMAIGASRPWYADYAGSGEGGQKVGGVTSNQVGFAPPPIGGQRLGGNAGVVYSPVGAWNSQIIIGGLKSQSLVTGGYRLGFNTYTIVATGGQKFGGLATHSRSSTPTPSGGMGIGGSTDASIGGSPLLRQVIVSGLLDGTLVTGGYIAPGQINVVSVSGGFGIGGAATQVYATSRDGAGGLKFGGLASTNFPSLVVGVGGSRFGGSAQVQEGVRAVASGGQAFGGTVIVAIPNPKFTAPRYIISTRVL